MWEKYGTKLKCFAIKKKEEEGENTFWKHEYWLKIHYNHITNNLTQVIRTGEIYFQSMNIDWKKINT